MQCLHQKSDGTRCNCHAIIGSSFCYTHNPGGKKKRIEASRKGGKATYSRDYKKLDQIPVYDTSSALYLIGDAINRIRVARTDGTMDLKTANAVGFLAGKLLECKKQLLYEENLLKNTICRDNKVNMATFRQLMSQYNDEVIQSARAVLEGAQERYEEHKKHKSSEYLF